MLQVLLLLACKFAILLGEEQWEGAEPEEAAKTRLEVDRGSAEEMDQSPETIQVIGPTAQHYSASEESLTGNLVFNKQLAHEQGLN